MCEKADKGGFSACIYVFSCAWLPSICSPEGLGAADIRRARGITPYAFGKVYFPWPQCPQTQVVKMLFIDCLVF